jgi:hypothetical protein
MSPVYEYQNYQFMNHGLPFSLGEGVKTGVIASS